VVNLANRDILNQLTVSKYINSERKILLVINPTAGKGLIKELPLAGVEAQGHQIKKSLTAFPGHATKIVQKALLTGYDLIVAVGGDGTFNEVINGFFRQDKLINPRAALLLIPNGTGSDFARTIKLQPRERSLEQLMASALLNYYDLGKITYLTHQGKNKMRYFINLIDVGLGGETVHQVNRKKARGGGLFTYLPAVLKKVFSYQNSRFTLEIDGERVLNKQISTVVVANGGFFGGGIEIATGADPTDGIFEIVVIGNMQPWQIVYHLPKVFKGTHYQHPQIHHYRGQQVNIITENKVLLDVDGEDPGTSPVSIEIMPGVLPIYIY